MPGILILNPKRLFEVKSGPTEIHTVGLNPRAEKPATMKAKKGGGLGSLGGTLDGWPVVPGKQRSGGSSMARERNL
jgi:hypothetical protein